MYCRINCDLARIEMVIREAIVNFFSNLTLKLKTICLFWHSLSTAMKNKAVSAAVLLQAVKYSFTLISFFIHFIDGQFKRCSLNLLACSWNPHAEKLFPEIKLLCSGVFFV